MGGRQAIGQSAHAGIISGSERKKSDAIVLLSGGLDSATCIYWAKKKFEKVSAITFNYFGRIENEKTATAELAKTAGVSDLIVVDLPFLKEASDFYSGNFKGGDADGMLASYMPARNMIFYSIAAHYSEFLGAKSIIGGHNTHDVLFFRDASKDYIQKINSLFQEACLFCNGESYQILLPLAEMDRKRVLELAIDLRVPIELTWSCHNNGNAHCGKCYACRQRIEAFNLLGLKDPVLH